MMGKLFCRSFKSSSAEARARPISALFIRQRPAFDCSLSEARSVLGRQIETEGLCTQNIIYLYIPLCAVDLYQDT